MGRSLIVHTLLAAIISCGCAAPRPDPQLLDQPVEAFTNPPVRPDEPVKEVPEQNKMDKYVAKPLMITGMIIGYLACFALQGLASNHYGFGHL